MTGRVVVSGGVVVTMDPDVGVLPDADVVKFFLPVLPVVQFRAQALGEALHGFFQAFKKQAVPARQRISSKTMIGDRQPFDHTPGGAVLEDWARRSGRSRVTADFR